MNPKSAILGTLGRIGQCRYCEKEFLIGNAQFGYRRSYCSAKCIKDRWRKDNLDAHNLTNKIWADKNKDYFDKYRKEKINKYKDKSLIPWSMQAKSNIAKGKILENWIVERLKLSGLDTRAARTPGSGNGKMKGDIWNDLNLCIEAKNQKNFSREWAKQAKRESLGSQVPIVVWHPPQTPMEDSVAIIDWGYLEELLLRAKEPKIKEMDRQMMWDLNGLKSAINKVLKNF